MSRLRLALLLLLGAGTAHASSWADLWATRDQQGQRLLDSKQPAAAAQMFSDPRRQGYAELEAGHYAAAAKLLEPYRDVDSQYNRGNALAHSGQLQQALGAYDAALASAPGNPDVIKNRDLVKRALDQQRQGNQQQQQGAKNGASGDRNSREVGPGGSSNNGSQATDGTQRGGSGSAKAQSSQPAGGSQSSPGSATQDRHTQQGQSQSATADAAAGHGRSASGAASAPGQAGGSNGAATQPRDTSPPGNQTSTLGQQGAVQAQNQQLDGSQPGGPSLPGTGKSDGGAQRAAGSYGQTSFAQGNPGRAGQVAQHDRDTVHSEALSSLQDQHSKASGRQQDQQPQSEQNLALDQWLRTIPEDSGELLQRKFMIEHLLKQRGNEP